MVLNNI